MTPLIQLNRQLHYFSIALLLACFAIAQGAQAITQEPDGGDANVNTAEEDDALLNLRAVTETGAMGHQSEHPNRREIRVVFSGFVPCAGEEVKLGGDLQIFFVNPRDVVKPGRAVPKNFGGFGVSTRRKYVVDDVNLELGEISRLGFGEFFVNFKVTGEPNRSPQADPAPGSPVHFRLKLKVVYEFSNEEVDRVRHYPPEPKCGQ